MTTYTFNITSAAQFNDDVALIDVGGNDAGGTNNTYNFNITASFTLDRQLDAINLTGGTASGNVLNISGAGASGGAATLDGNKTYNGLFVYNGTVNIDNLTIANAVAKGGSGGDSGRTTGGGGGGAGLGGGLFVAGPNAVAVGSSTKTTGGDVTLTNVAFTGNSAVGGAGGSGGDFNSSSRNAGGGGGLGGAGGNGAGAFVGSGGGGVGLGASGGTNYGSGGNGIILGAGPGGSTPKNSMGGADGGGGAGGGFGGGGAGGVGGGDVIAHGSSYYGSPKAGFGGGGGGGGGNGGFGGGGGGSYNGGGNGGFGGGGAGGDINGPGYGNGGFGGGHNGSAFAGGGGLGAGGDIFVQQGGELTVGAGSSLAAGTVKGGAGGKFIFDGTLGTPGAAFGNGLFIQGSQTVTFGGTGSIGSNITVAGVIADEGGSVVPTGVGGGTGAGAVSIEDALVTLSAANTYSGGTTIAGGTLDLAHADAVSGGRVVSGAAGIGAIAFAGTAAHPSNLALEAAAQPANGGTFATTLTNFGANDALLLKGLAYTAGSTATYDSSSHLLTVTSNGVIEKFTLNAPGATTFYTHPQTFGGEALRVDAVCFCAGTLIRTTRGDVAIEHLVVGDLVVTASGDPRPIRWLGHRSVGCRAHPHPQGAMPIRIAAHAFGENRPARDLFVSPGHSICIDILGEVLIPAAALVNGATIQQVEVDAVTYWHVELDSHDVILAENLACESYLDMGNRGFFQEADVFDLAAGPDADPSQYPHADFCRPFHDAGPVVEAVREQMRRRATDLGWTLTDDIDLHLEVDGRRLDPVLRDLSARFEVPADATDVWLVSPTARPCDTTGTADRRDLGVDVAALRIEDGLSAPRAIAIDDPLLCIGFHDVEEGVRRWTAGRARLPVALWQGCEDGFCLRLDLAGTPVPRWEQLQVADAETANTFLQRDLWAVPI